MIENRLNHELARIYRFHRFSAESPVPYCALTHLVTSGLHGVGQFLTHIQARFTPLQDGFTAKLFKTRKCAG